MSWTTCSPSAQDPLRKLVGELVGDGRLTRHKLAGDGRLTRHKLAGQLLYCAADRARGAC